jgi:hypothetical protein
MVEKIRDISSTVSEFRHDVFGTVEQCRFLSRFATIEDVFDLSFTTIEIGYRGHVCTTGKQQVREMIANKNGESQFPFQLYIYGVSCMPSIFVDVFEGGKVSCYEDISMPGG